MAFASAVPWDAILLLALVGIGVAAGLLYNSIKGNMAYPGDAGELAGVLTETDCWEPFCVLVIGSDRGNDSDAWRRKLIRQHAQRRVVTGQRSVVAAVPLG